MRLRHIEVFNAVMLTGSVSEAARLINVTQPAVSRTLQHAEIQLGFPLFQRAKGRLTPTTEALTLFPHIERLFAQLDEVQRLALQTGAALNVNGRTFNAGMEREEVPIRPPAPPADEPMQEPETPAPAQTPGQDSIAAAIAEAARINAAALEGAMAALKPAQAPAAAGRCCNGCSCAAATAPVHQGGP